MKTALVLEGGAMRGMYTCGVLDSFLDMGISFPYAVGVSAGAAFGVCYFSRQRGRNLEVYKKYLNDKRYISYGNLLREGSLFGLKFVYEDVPQIHIPFDFDTYYNSPADFYSVVTNIRTGKPEYINKDKKDKKFDLLKATCALPLFSPDIKIDGERYLDGGLTDPIPFDKALSDGCDRAVVILTQHKGYEKKAQKMILPVAARYFRHPAVAEALKKRHLLYNRQLKELYQLEKEGRVLILQPKEPVSFKRIETDLEKLTALYHIGEKDGAEAEKRLLNFLS